LYMGGVDKVYLVVGYQGDKIVADIKACHALRHLEIEVIDLGPEYSEGYARSLMAAQGQLRLDPRVMLHDRFILSTADHIFEQGIVSEMATTGLTPDVPAVVLVEEEPSEPSQLPSTCVKVMLDPSRTRVLDIGSDLCTASAIEAGLFCLRPSAFETFVHLANSSVYFTVADVLRHLAQRHCLAALPVAGRLWFGLETQDAVLGAADMDIGASTKILSGRSTSFSNLAALTTDTSDLQPAMNLLLGFAASTQAEVSVLENMAAPSSAQIGGFIFGVEHVEHFSPGTSSPMPFSFSPSTHPNLSEASQPFLSPSNPSLLSHDRMYDMADTPQPHPPSEATISKMFSNDTHALVDNAFVLSVPAQVTAHPEELDGTQGYLIAIADGQGDDKLMFAVPEVRQMGSEAEPNAWRLPTDVTDATIQYTTNPDSGVTLQMSVTRRVPHIGYVILIVACIAISSSGPAAELQTGPSSYMKLWWRVFFTTLFISLIVLGKYAYGVPMDFPGREIWPALLGTCFGYWFYIGAYQVSLAYTSVTNATLLANIPACFLVIKKLCWREPVTYLEMLGACIALAGSVLVAHPWLTDSTSASSTEVAPSFKGDAIAMLAGLGGALYLDQGKKVRAKLDVFAMSVAMNGSTSFISLIVVLALEWDTVQVFDHNATQNSLLGFLDPTIATRLLNQVYLTVVVDIGGIVGYISAMKYFDPLIVSVVMIMEPIVATVQGMIVGVSVLPSTWGLVGAAIVLVGSGLVVASSGSHEDKVETAVATDAGVTKLEDKRGAVNV